MIGNWRDRRWLFVCLCAAVFTLSTDTRADSDLWGHLRFGLDMLRQHRLTAIDPYSFTQDVAWINHEWLSELQMALVWRALGSAGLALLKGALLTGTGLFLWPSLGRLRISDRVGVLLLLVIGTIHMWAFMRPQLWTLLFFVILCRILRTARLPWVLPLVFAVWANCHGGWVVGLAVLGVWTAVSAAGQLEGWRTWAVVFPISLAATLLNPYGWTLWTFLWRTVPGPRAIQEWLPLWKAPALNWLPWGVAVAGVVWVVARRARDLTRLRSSAVLAILAVEAARVQRVESLFVVAAVVFLTPELASARPLVPRATSPRAIALIPTCLVGTLVLSSVTLAHTLRCIRLAGDSARDAKASALLRDARPGRLVTFFDWGEYAIWEFGPRLKVSIDGRRETVYSDTRLAGSDAIVAGADSGLDLLRRWQPEYVWLPASSAATRRWLLANGYRVEHESSQSFVAVRSDLPPLVARPQTGPAGCFPQ